jgi:hypothetical protein
MFSFLYHCQDFYRTWLYIWVTRWVASKKQELIIPRVHPRVFGGVSGAHRFNLLCCPIMCPYVLSSVLWYPLPFSPKTMFDSSAKTTAYSSEAYDFTSVFVFVFVLFHHNFYMHCFFRLVCVMFAPLSFLSFFLLLLVIVLIVFPSINSFWFPSCCRQLFLNLKFVYNIML